MAGYKFIGRRGRVQAQRSGAAPRRRQGESRHSGDHVAHRFLAAARRWNWRIWLEFHGQPGGLFTFRIRSFIPIPYQMLGNRPCLDNKLMSRESEKIRAEAWISRLVEETKYGIQEYKEIRAENEVRANKHWKKEKK